MHVRTNVVRSGTKTYRYTQIVQSYRNNNGRSVHKVLASFRDLPPVFVDNFKAAIAAARDDRAVVVADELLASMATPKTRANLDYLGVAVLLHVWNAWRLSELLDQLLPSRSSQVPVAEMVAALAIHRCIEPSPKIRTSEWFPGSALPELQGVLPGRFNNTRVHRVLDDLESIEEALQERLPKRIEAVQGPLVALFLDLSDTWFVGHGPPLAATGRTKEGLVKRRIGIVLLCDQRGMPIRWKTIKGKYREHDEMEKLIEELKEQGWVGQAPFVMDRAMGRAASVEFLCNSGVRFLTALPVDEFQSYSSRIPLEAMGSIVVANTQASYNKDLERAREAALEAGFVKLDDNRYVLDLGIFEKGEGVERPKPRKPKSASTSPSRAVKALQAARAMQADLDAGIVSDNNDLAARRQCTPRSIRQYRALLRLTAELQRKVLAGAADALTKGDLHSVARLPADQQSEAFDKLCADRTANPRRTGGPQPALREDDDDDSEPPPIKIRGVVHFNPERFLRQRRTAAEHLRELDAFVADLNRRLSSPHCRRKERAVYEEVARELRRYKLFGAFEIEIRRIGDRSPPRWHVVLHRNEQQWARRRRTDGMNVFVGHPDLPYSPADIVHLYFAKDLVEKDFQLIKSEVDLRPIWHRTDGKVRAHVTLCMLALLLERTLEHMLAKAGLQMTAARCLATLKTCHLNMYAGTWGPAYSVTELTTDQREILSALGLEALADDAAVAENIAPR